MIRLVAAELVRYRSRRAVRFVALISMLGIALTAVLVFVNSDRSQDPTRYEAQVADCVRFHESREGAGFVPPEFEDAEEFCRQAALPPEEAFDERFHLTSVQDVVEGATVFLIILGLALGASFIGAEWGAGTLATTLTWEPRRVRLFVAKAVAAFLFVFMSAALLEVALGLALVPAAAFRGTTAGTDAEWLRETIGVILRGSLIASILAVCGMAIASVARNTTTALVIGFVYLAVLEQLLRAWKPGWARWLLSDNAGLFVTGQSFMLAHSRTRAFVTLAGYAVALVAAGALLFRQRDVT